MPFDETNSLKNNTNLTEHFLYTYSSYNKYGPQEKVRDLFNEDLIFDRSRKSIFTQSQEYGYISDTVYTLYVDKDTSSYVTLRSYEGNVELYQYVPFAIKSMTYEIDVPETNANYAANIDHVYEAGKIMKIKNLSILHDGTDKLEYCYIAINGQIKSEYVPGTLGGKITIPNSELSKIYSNLIIGENTLTFFAYSSINTYFNIDENKAHDTVPRFKPEKFTSYSQITAKIYAYNPTYLLQLPETYWSAYDKKTELSITADNVVKGVFCNDWGCLTYNDHFVCENCKNQTMGLGVPARLVDEDILYGMVGGSSQEFYKLNSFELACGYPEQYNIYVATSDNWIGQELWFYPRKYATLPQYPYYIDVVCKKSGQMRIWPHYIGGSSIVVIYGDVIANKTSRIGIYYNISNNCEHLIQTGGDQVDVIKIDLRGYTVTNVINANLMFGGCSTVEEINFGNMTFASNCECKYMFEGCKNLKKIICKSATKTWILNHLTATSAPANMSSLVWEII